VPGDLQPRAALGYLFGAMAGAFDLRVPLAVNLSFGASWADTKG